MLVSRAWLGVMLALLASCSSTGDVAPPSLVGEWRTVSDAGAQFMFFAVDGTCGEGDESAAGPTLCMPGTYRYEGGSIYITANNTTNNIPVTLENDTFTMRGLNQELIVYTRENSLPSNRCP